MKVTFLKALNGDSIHIRFKDEENNYRNILIDGGPPRAYKYRNKKTKKRDDGDLKKTIDEVRKRKEIIDLLILTHVDDDHIGGLLQWFKEDGEAENQIKKVWFNSGRLIFQYFKSNENKDNINDLIIGRPIDDSLDTGISHGNTFEDIISKAGIWDRKLVKSDRKIDWYNLTFRFLSPSEDKLKKLLNKWKKETPNLDTSDVNDYKMSLSDLLEEDKFEEDGKPHNGSSIAFILTYNNKNMLFLGDAHPSVIIDSLNTLQYSKGSPIKAEFVKVSHHGSKKNTNIDLLELIDSDQYIFSSNGSYHNLPDKQCIARIVKNNPNVTLYFNYKELMGKIFMDQDKDDFPNFNYEEVKVFPL